MEKIILNLNADSVVQLHNGFVGVQLIFANLAIKNNAKVKNLTKRKRKTCLNVKVKNIVN